MEYQQSPLLGCKILFFSHFNWFHFKVLRLIDWLRCVCCVLKLQSVSYTAAPLFVVAGIWFLGFGICLLVICICHICHRSKSIGYSKVAYVVSLIFLLFFTLIAMWAKEKKNTNFALNSIHIMFWLCVLSVLSFFSSQNRMCSAILGSGQVQQKHNRDVTVCREPSR